MEKTNIGLSDHARKAAEEHVPYCYGTYGKIFTKDILNSKKKQYPSHYTADRMPKYEQFVAEKRRSHDCIGLIKGYMWERDDGSIGYAINGCGDYSANGMYEKAKVKGDIKTLPEVPGIVLHMDCHVGVYLGNGLVSEARGFAYGTVFTKLSARKWLHWFEAPGCKYIYDTPSRTYLYMKGMQGPEIQYLQSNLIMLGYSLPKYGADGDYGEETATAVRAFQKDQMREQTGNMTQEDMDIMNAVMKDLYAHHAIEKNKEVIATGNVYTRFEPNVQAKSAGVLYKNETAPYLGETSDNGWNKIMYDGKVCWVSGKYSKVVDK